MLIFRHWRVVMAVAWIAGACSDSRPTSGTEAPPAEAVTAAEPAQPKPQMSTRDKLAALAAEDCGRIPLPTVREVLQAPALGQDFARSNESVAMCRFADKAGAGVLIHVQRGSTQQSFERSRQASWGDKAKDVPGLGGAAYVIAQGNETTLGVHSGDRSLLLTGSFDQARLEALAKKLLELLPPS